MPHAGQTPTAPNDGPAGVPSLIRAFGATRMAVGALSWAAPSLTARVPGLDPDSKQPVVSQLFGVRDFALGFLTATRTGATRAQVLRLGVMIDVVDTVASLRQIRAGTLSTQGAILVGGGAALFAAIGAAALAGEEILGAGAQHD